MPQGDPSLCWSGSSGFPYLAGRERAPGRLHGLAEADVIDGSSCRAFVNSSLAPAVLFRRRLRSVGDVLEGIRRNGFSTSWLQALILR